jgi:hypothetical protein
MWDTFVIDSRRITINCRNIGGKVKITAKLITAKRQTADVRLNQNPGMYRNRLYLRGWEEGKLASYKIQGRPNMQGSAESIALK